MTQVKLSVTIEQGIGFVMLYRVLDWPAPLPDIGDTVSLGEGLGEEVVTGLLTPPEQQLVTVLFLPEPADVQARRAELEAAGYTVEVRPHEPRRSGAEPVSG